jgi:hypothetical protein
MKYFSIKELPKYESSQSLPQYHIFCPCCGLGEATESIYLGATMECLGCNNDFILTKECVVVG